MLAMTSLWRYIAVMDLEPHLRNLHQALAAAAAAGGEEVVALIERFALPLDAAFRLAMLDVVSSAASEVSEAIAPGRVEVRWHDRNPDLVVTPPPDAEPFSAADGRAEPAAGPEGPPGEPGEQDDVLARVSLRLPARLKNQVDDLAAQAGMSSNAWLVRAVAAAAADQARRPPRSGLHVGQRYSGWSS
jgi:hypothetical protein